MGAAELEVSEHMPNPAICEASQKIKYSDQDEAAKAIRGILKKDHVLLRAYRCSDCGSLHLTSQPRKEARWEKAFRRSRDGVDRQD